MEHNNSSFFEFLKSVISHCLSHIFRDRIQPFFNYHRHGLVHEEKWLRKPINIAIRYSLISSMNCASVDVPGASTSELDDARSHDYSNSYPAIERVLKQMRARLNITPFSKSNSRRDALVGKQTLIERQIAFQTSTITSSVKCIAVSNRDITFSDADDLFDQKRIVDQKVDDFNLQTSKGRAAHHHIFSAEGRQLKETNNGGNIQKKKTSVTTVAHTSRDEKVAHIRLTALNMNCLKKRKVFIAKQLAVLSLSCPS